MKIRSAITYPTMLLCASVLLAACSHKTPDNSPVVATVNKEDITQAQLDYARSEIVLQHPAASAPENAQVLQGLIEQRLVSQKAEKDKLDRNPGVLQALESARKDALARYYLEQMTAKVPKPTDDEVKQYYDSHPANFAQRNVYVIQKIDARATAEQAPALAAAVQATSTPAEAIDLLKARTGSVNVSQTPQPAESLGPLLPRIAALPVGHTLALPQRGGLSALTVVSVQQAPVSPDQARVTIEQLLWNQRKREAIQAQSKSLRAVARIEYLGKFALGAASAPVGDTPAVAAPNASGAASQ